MALALLYVSAVKMVHEHVNIYYIDFGKIDVFQNIEVLILSYDKTGIRCNRTIHKLLPKIVL